MATQVQDLDLATKGFEGIWKITTRLTSEREIDVDDRGVDILFSVEMKPDANFTFKAEELDVEIDFSGNTMTGVDVMKRGEATGPTNRKLKVIAASEKVTMFPGKAVDRELTVRTGIFSSAALDAPSTEAGLKQAAVTIKYKLVPMNPNNKQSSALVFVVAGD